MHFTYSVRFLGRLALAALIVASILATGTAAKDRLPSARLSFKTHLVPSGTSTDTSIEYDSLGLSISAIQFDVEHDPTLFGITATAGDVVVNAGKNFVTTALENGNLRILIFGLDQTRLGSG